MLILEVITIFLVAIAMSMAVAHALEFPGKLRLDHKTYATVQTIYYPGFTVAGVGEPLAAVAVLILLLILPGRGTAFWWVLSAFIALLLMHAVFWFVTQPTNRYWLRSQKLSRAGLSSLPLIGPPSPERTLPTTTTWSGSTSVTDGSIHTLSAQFFPSSL